MKKNRFSVEQIVAMLKQAERALPVAEINRQGGISEQTSYRWRKQYAGIESDQVCELKQRQDENTRLKKLGAESSVDKAILQKIKAKEWPGPLSPKAERGPAAPLSAQDIVHAMIDSSEGTVPGYGIAHGIRSSVTRDGVIGRDNCTAAGILRLSLARTATLSVASFPTPHTRRCGERR